MTCNEQSIVKVDTSVPDDQLALIGCGVTTGVGAALFTAKVKPGATVAVIGCGGVGQSVIQGARIAGASRIFAIDPVELKRKTAEQLGATDFVDPNAGDPVAQVQQLTSGRGVVFASVNITWWAGHIQNMMQSADPTHLPLYLTNNILLHIGPYKTGSTALQWPSLLY